MFVGDIESGNRVLFGSAFTAAPATRGHKQPLRLRRVLQHGRDAFGLEEVAQFLDERILRIESSSSPSPHRSAAHRSTAHGPAGWRSAGGHDWRHEARLAAQNESILELALVLSQLLALRGFENHHVAFNIAL